MPKDATLTSSGLVSGHSVVRLLIVSYFMALAIGLIPGTDIAILADPFMPWIAARVLTGAAVFVLASLILFGIQRRAAALLLAVVIFWASYVTMLSAEGAQVLGGFWRDLALIGALILTYADTEHATQNDAAAVLQNLPRGTTDIDQPFDNPSRLSPSVAVAKVRRTSENGSSKAKYVEDLNHVRAS